MAKKLNDSCESCGAGGCTDQSKCAACGMTICQSCCDVFDHVGGGLHGFGDPRLECIEMRSRISDLKEDSETWKRRFEWAANECNYTEQREDRCDAVSWQPGNLIAEWVEGKTQEEAVDKAIEAEEE